MNRIISSFTAGERNIIVFVLLLVAGGYGIQEWQLAGRRTMAFSASPLSENESPAKAAVMPPGIAAGGLIDINKADEKILEALPGVGPALAGAILRFRVSHGGFRSMADLDQVPGIGPGMMEKVGPRITFDSAPTLQPVAVPVAPVPGTAPITAVVGNSGIVNVNQGGEVELDKLKGVGPKLAQRIMLDRQQNGPFRSASDLLRVKGIGPKIIKDNAEKIAVN